MVSIVPINEYEIAQIIFDYSEDIPNDFYVHIMNLVKLYYENGNNLQEIHVYIEENKNRIDKHVLLKIKKSLQPQKNCNCNCNCCNCCNFTSIMWTTFIIFFILMIPTVIILNTF